MAVGDAEEIVVLPEICGSHANDGIAYVEIAPDVVRPFHVIPVRGGGYVWQIVR